MPPRSTNAEPKVKRTKTKLNVILMDVNRTAGERALSNPPKQSDYDVAAKVADSILCREIFAQSKELFLVIHFGLEGAQPFTCGDFAPPNFNLVDSLHAVIPGTSVTANVADALEFATAEMQKIIDEHGEHLIEEARIYLFSNLQCSDDSTLTQSYAKDVGRSVRNLPAKLIIMSPDDVLGSKSAAFSFCTMLAKECEEMEWVAFTDAEKRYAAFEPKSTVPRGSPFVLNLSADWGIKLQMFVKNDTGVAIEHKFVPCQPDKTQDLAKHFHYKTAPIVAVTAAQIDEMPDREFQSNRFSATEAARKIVSTEDLVKAYYYGKSLVPTTDLEIDLFKSERSVKHLSLVNFTKRENILPQYIQGSPRYLLPASNASGSQEMLGQLVRTMIAEDVVAIASYAYSAIAHPRAVCLLPKRTKTGMPVLIHYPLPYLEDCRNYEFPPLMTENDDEFADYQMDSIDSFVDTCMLAEDDGTNESHRPKNTLNPKLQHECNLLRYKVLQPEKSLTDLKGASAMLTPLNMPEREESTKQDLFTSLSEAFPLERCTNVRLPPQFTCRDFGVYAPIDPKSAPYEDYKGGKKTSDE